VKDDATGDGGHRAWAHLRFAIIGPLLACPPRTGELQSAIDALTERTWRHPTDSHREVRFGFSTIERWYYAARSEADPVGVLARRVRKDAGKDKAITQALLEELARQYAAHRGWSYKLHAGVRRVRRARRVEHAPAALVEVEVPQGVDRDRLVRARLAVLASEQGAPLARRGMPWNAVRPPPAALHRLAHRRVARRWAEPCVVGLRQHREVVGFEARFGPVPLTLLSWVRIVGDVWLVGTHPLWPESAGRGPPRDRGGRDTLRRAATQTREEIERELINEALKETNGDVVRAAERLGVSQREMAQRFDAIVQYAELERFIDTPLKHYSSGMYMRLGFAVAVHVDPDILVIDEVLAVGDCPKGCPGSQALDRRLSSRVLRAGPSPS